MKYVMIFIVCLMCVGCSRYTIEDDIDYSEGKVGLTCYAWHYQGIDMDIIASEYKCGVPINEIDYIEDFFRDSHAKMTKAIDEHKIKKEAYRKMRKDIKKILR